ncbi:unnamed protein product [Mytilus edulis]|uniref:Uncharacterized protein n=1 Tax=Mytilus edulis TaxID=6550 RepID=A0A8S3PW22_MYTED|nr:unnamed protein product [Mytilus edulis]
MNQHTYIYTSSRGKVLEGKVRCKTLRVVPGGKLETLCKYAYDDLKDIDGLKIVYFIAGIPDICSLERNRRSNYEESFLKRTDNSCFEHALRLKNTIVNTETKLKSINCKVVFATITTMSFCLWNLHRLSIGKTSHLKYENAYDRMQLELNSIIQDVNNFITEFNQTNHVITPFFILLYINVRVENLDICITD